MNIGLKNVSRQYKGRGKIAYEDMEFLSNRINIVRGNNGTGKTTLLNIIAGLDKKYEGDLSYDGENFNRDIAREITLVSQKPYLFKKSVYENIAYPLKLRNLDSRIIDKKIGELSKKLDIERLLNKRADRLSGGETQKVSLARGIVFSPRVLLLDEFTSGIDTTMLEAMESMILEYREKTSANIILISHSKDQIDRIGDTITDLSL